MRERTRRERRRLWWSLPGIVLAAALGLWLVLLWAWSVSAAGAFADGDHAAAAESYQRQGALSRAWPERWKAPYNEGTTRLAQGWNSNAEESLRRALELVPAAKANPDGTLDPASPECKVRRNLSLALEGLAVQADARGNTSAAETIRTEAAAVLEPCATQGQGEPSESPSGSPSEPPSPSESPSESPSPSPTPSPPDPRLEELQERNDRAREEAEQQGEGGGFGGGQNW